MDALDLSDRRLPVIAATPVRDWIRSRSWARALATAAPVLVLMALFITTGVRGVDFGFHWDESAWQIQPVRDMVSTGLLLPRATIYPAATKWLVLLPSLPSGIRAALSGDSTPRAIQAAMLAAIDAPDYLLTVRRFFIVVSALAIPWVYLAVVALRRRWWEAFVAGACVALSWEYAYHARWVATDCILAQVSALTLLMLALFQRAGKPAWLYAAAIAAGLGAGTKFQGVLLLVPVILASLLRPPYTTRPLAKIQRQARRLVAVGSLAFAAYLITTPATVFEPFAFSEQLHFISSYYARGHYGHSVSGVWEHWRIVLTYFSMAYLSPFPVGAVALFVAAVFGAIVWARNDRRAAVVFLILPIGFLCFFCFKYRAVIVRNYLLVGPFLALFAARGVGEVFQRLSREWARWSLAGALTLLFGLQAVWLIRAGESIRFRDSKADVRESIAYVARHPDTRFRLSNQIRALAAAQNVTLPSNVTDGPDAQSLVFFAIAEGPSSGDWKTNDPWQTQAVFGPREVNFDWYSGWSGADRVVVLSVAKAKATGAPLAR